MTKQYPAEDRERLPRDLAEAGNFCGMLSGVTKCKRMT